MKMFIEPNSLRIPKKDLKLPEMVKITNYKRGITIEEYPSHYVIKGPKADLYNFMCSMSQDFDIDLV